MSRVSGVSGDVEASRLAAELARVGLDCLSVAEKAPGPDGCGEYVVMRGRGEWHPDSYVVMLLVRDAQSALKVLACLPDGLFTMPAPGESPAEQDSAVRYFGSALRYLTVALMSAQDELARLRGERPSLSDVHAAKKVEGGWQPLCGTMKSAQVTTLPEFVTCKECKVLLREPRIRAAAPKNGLNDREAVHAALDPTDSHDVGALCGAQHGKRTTAVAEVTCKDCRVRLMTNLRDRP
jgi:hypothetical protein